MWNKLTFTHKKALSFFVFFILLCIAYQLSISKAIATIKLNRQLNNEELEIQNVGTAYPQAESKHSFYNKALKLYHVKAEDRENRLWQTVSGIALTKAVKISFDPVSAPSDTSASTHRIFMHEFNFKGDYFKCVSLLDSLSKTRDIGVISSVKLIKPKESDQAQAQLLLKLTLAMQTDSVF